MTRFRTTQDIRAWLDTAITKDDSPLFAQAAALTRKHFGHTMELFTPLYLSNHCQNGCIYCGFQASRSQVRKTLSESEILREAKAIAADGHGSLLLLSGESPKEIPLSYLARAIRICRPYFAKISLEVYPMDVEEYRFLRSEGLDGVTLYQETYDPERYRLVHPYGPKRNYIYRKEAPRRILEAGIPFLTMGILLGLSSPANDLTALYRHHQVLRQTYPGAVIALSFPRLRPVPGDRERYCPIDSDSLLKIIAISRLSFPHSPIVLSTRESSSLRQKATVIGVTMMSAASQTAVGGHAQNPESDQQFDVLDTRSLKEIKRDLQNQGFDAVCRNWHHLT